MYNPFLKTISLFSLFLLAACTSTQTMNQTTSNNTKPETAFFSGGCFWCIEAPFQETSGVIDSISGYIGDNKGNASYKKVSSGLTKHRESVRVTYDPSIVTYGDLLNIFWRQIDPTDAEGQFSDRGYHYTTAIYYTSAVQQEIATKSKNNLDQSEKFKHPIVTEILPLPNFFEAEDYHQDFYKKSADHYKQYKKGSGREDFIEENWAKRAALAFSDESVLWDKRRNELDELSRKVMLQDGTETPFENDFWDNDSEGLYVDKVTGEPLFLSTDKYKSGTGWPSFTNPISPEAIQLKTDFKLIYPRKEVRSAAGDHHLGHVFNDGPPEKGGKRYCLNSASMDFIPVEKLKENNLEEYLELFD